MKKIQHALDYMEIQNIMAKHVYYFNAQGGRVREADSETLGSVASRFQRSGVVLLSLTRMLKRETQV